MYVILENNETVVAKYLSREEAEEAASWLNSTNSIYYYHVVKQ